MEPDKTLEGILELLDTKSTMRDFVEAFGVAIDHISEMKAENEQERGALKAQVSDSVDKAIQRITTGSQQEWTKIRAQVALLRDGENYVLTEADKKEIAGLISVPIVEKITERTEIIHEQPIVKEMAVGDTSDEVVRKINESKLLISKERIDGLVEALSQMVHSGVGTTTNFFNGLRAKNLTINGATATQRGDTVFLTVSGSGGGQVNSVVAGTGISVDSTDPANPIVSATGSGVTVETPTGTVDGSNTSFTTTNTPKWIAVDGVMKFLTLNYTYAANTITITDGAPPVFSIRNFY